MIQINDTFEILSNNPPYLYSWTFNKPCVTATPTTGTATNMVELSLQAEEACFPITATLQLVDTLGCITSIPYEYTNPCVRFSQPVLSQSGNSFTVTNPGSTDVTYSWTYSDGIVGVANENTLEVSFPNTYFLEYVVSCEITLPNNCKKYVSGTFTYSRPLAQNFRVYGRCLYNQTNLWSSFNFTLDVTSAYPINHNLTTIKLNGVSVPYARISPNLYRLFSSDPNTLNRQLFYRYTVTDIYGNVSNEASIRILTPNCTVESDNPVITPE